MQNKLVRFITTWDLFPATYQPPIFNDKKNSYQNVSGAIGSSFVFIMGFSYLFYLLMEYADGVRLPTVCISHIQYNKTNEINLSFQPYKLSLISFLEKEKIQQYKNDPIFTQKDYLYKNNTFESVGQLQQMNCTYDIYTIKDTQIFNSTGCVNSESQKTLKQNPNDNTQDIEFYSYYKHCQLNSTACLNPDQEIALIPYWQIKVFYQIINFQTGEYQIVSRDFIKAYVPNKTFEVMIRIRKATVRVDTGMFIPDISEYEIISGIDVNAENTDAYFWDNNTLMSEAFISLDPVQEIINISYQRLPEVFAGFQTTFSFLVLIGLLIQEFNSRILQLNLLDQLTKIFFPEFRKFRIIRNFQNKITQIYQNGNEIQNTQNLINFQKRIEDTLQSKIGYLNIVRAISRLEIAFTMIFGQDFLVSLDGLGYQIPFLEEEEEELNDVEISKQGSLQNREQLLIFSEQQFQRISKFEEENMHILDQNDLPPIQDQVILKQFIGAIEFRKKKLLQNQSCNLQLKKKENPTVRKVSPQTNNQIVQINNLNESNADIIQQLDDHSL